MRSGPEPPPPLALSGLADLLAVHAGPGRTAVIGVTGSVAVGKSTLCAGLVTHLTARLRAETVSTDGFLLPNAVLATRDLLMRKGYPETYDALALATALRAARTGAATFRGYSHMTYDVDPAQDRTITGADILFVEGLGLGDARGHVDALVYLDADETDLETWYVRRFLGFWRAAEHDPASFYARFRTMSETEADAFARTVWAQINLPNLRDHILPVRDHAHIVLRKDADHTLRLVRGA